VAIVGNSGGPGILAADACEAIGLSVPALSLPTQVALRADLAAGAAVVNPVDLLATANGADYERALRAVIADENVDAVLVIFAPPLVTTADAIAAAIQTVANEATGKPILASFLTADEFRMVPAAVTVPCYSLPEQAIAALGRANGYACWRSAPIGRRPQLSGIDAGDARAVIDSALAQQAGGQWLPPEAAQRLAESYGINVVSTVSVRSAEEAVAAADAAGYPVVLKSWGPALVHKSEAGGVCRGLLSAADVSSAYRAMVAALGATMHGGIVQPMIATGIETIVGLVQDPSFGPLVMVGLGGVATDLLGDRAFRMLPLTDLDAHEMVSSLRSAPLLSGYRGSAPTDVAALEDVILRVAQLGDENPEVVEIDLNPLIVSPEGVVAVDIKIRLSPGSWPAFVDPTTRQLRARG
jgi:acyl-CoA synthetase (NDP forming)